MFPAGSPLCGDSRLGTLGGIRKHVVLGPFLHPSPTMGP